MQPPLWLPYGWFSETQMICSLEGSACLGFSFETLNRETTDLLGFVAE